MDKRIRFVIQSILTLIQNANFKGFFTGRIYKGAGKNLCVPGINCYSCPGALGACPLGSLQSSLTEQKFRFPYYVLGLLLFFGTLLGRAVCGFLCPFGLVQDLCYEVPVEKIRKVPGDRWLRKLKYVILILFVIVLPICVKLTPFFCKYLCPSGTLAGVLLALADRSLFRVMGSTWWWKMSVLLAVLLLSAFLFRPFCKYLCPLGAFYALFNKVSLLRIEVDTHACMSCHRCSKVCRMGCDPLQDPNSPECIRCGECIEFCPKDAIKYRSVLEYGKKEKEHAE